MRFCLAILVASVLSASCRRAATEIVVVVGSDFQVPIPLSEIRARVAGQDGATTAEHVFKLVAGQPGTAEFVLPLSFAVTARAEQLSERAQIELSALSADGSVLMQRTALTGFVEGRLLVLPMFLASRCATQSCTGGTTCTERGCISPDPGPLPDYNVADPFGSLSQDAGPLADAATPIDASLDAAAHADAQDGSMLDAAALDADPIDAAALDAGALDAAALEAGAPEAGALEAGALEAGALDASPDASALDAGPLDAVVCNGLRAGGHPQVVGSAPIQTLLSASGQTPVVARDAAGNAIAIWVQTLQLDPSQIWASRYDALSGNWSSPQRLDVGTDPAALPVVAMNAAGVAIAAWIAFGTSSIVTAVRFDGSSWSAPVGVSTMGSASALALAIDPMGRAILAWRDQGGVMGSVFRASWVAPVPLKANSNAGDYPAVAMNAFGAGIVVWQELNGSYISLWSRTVTASAATFGAAELANGNSTESIENASVALGPSGEAVAAWRRTGISQIWSNHRTPAIGWASAQRIDSTSGAASDRETSIGADACGNMVVAFAQKPSAAAAYTMMANQYHPGVGWTGAVQVGALSNVEQIPKVAVTPSGIAVVSWGEFPAAAPSNLGVNSLVGGAWAGSPVMLSDGAAVFGSLAVEPGGGAILVYQVTGQIRGTVLR